MSNPQHPGEPLTSEEEVSLEQSAAQPLVSEAAVSQAQPLSPAPADTQPLPTGDVWEQSQPTGDVWDPQTAEAWGQQAPPSPPPPPPAASYQSPPPTAENMAKGFITALFDFSFDSYITHKVIKTVYIIMTVVVGVATLLAFIAALATGIPLNIIIALLLLPLVAMILLALLRMTLEVFHAIIRMSDDIRQRLPRR